MSITHGELAQYKEGDIVMTRSFLSTSEERSKAELFIPGSDDKKQSVNEDEKQSVNKNEKQSINGEEKQPVTCIYKVINRRTSLHIKKLSIFPEEKEVLILPFAVFRIIKIDFNKDENKKNSPVIITLEECESNL
jgi:hypothetical protein